MTRTAFLLSAAVLLVAAPAWAQEQPADPAGRAADSALKPELGVDEEDVEEITVVARRDPTAVIGDIPPENTLSGRDIRAYGTGSVAELLDALAPQLGSGRGRGESRPVVLLNGRRTSGFREVRDLPPEAILRMDILPEEVALKYGYRADQRVVNIVLRPRFRSTTVRAEGRAPTDGGSLRGEYDVTSLMIGEASRTTLNAHVEGLSALTEDERDIRFDSATGDPDPRSFRTLQGSTHLGRLGATHNRTLFGDVSSTIDGQVERSRGRSLLGPSLLLVGDPLGRDTDTLSGHLGVALNGEQNRWRWSLTGAYDIARSVTETDREEASLFDAYADRARTVTSSGNLDLVLNGPLLELPAGRATTTVRLGADNRRLESRVRRAGRVSETDLDRDRGSASVSVDLPIARRNGPLSAIGNLSVNANAEVEGLSDFGTLTTIGAGFFWSPFERFNLIGSWTREEGPPSLNQLGDPELLTPDSRIFDFTRGETVLVEARTGGNRDLDADRRQVLKLGASWQPLKETDLNLRADFVRTRIDNPISGFPGITQAIEDAFPERFQRDLATGELLSVDLRPVNFDRSAKDELRWGFNYTRPLTSARPPQSVLDQFRRQFGAGQGARREPRAEGERRAGGGGRGGFGGRGGGRQGGRLTASLYHTWVMTDEVRIAPGLPTLDYLSGDVVEGGFRPHHRLEGDAGWFNNGLGVRVSGNWQNGGEVGDGEDALEFGSLAKFNLNLFANLGERWELVAKHPWLRGTQLRLGVQNIFDAKQRVRDASRDVPVNYQPDLLDPLGRAITVSFRKQFLPPPGSLRRERQR